MPHLPPATPQDPGRLGRATSGALNRTWLIWLCTCQEGQAQPSTWRLNWASESTLHTSTSSQAPVGPLWCKHIPLLADKQGPIQGSRPG